MLSKLPSPFPSLPFPSLPPSLSLSLSIPGKISSYNPKLNLMDPVNGQKNPPDSNMRQRGNFECTRIAFSLPNCLNRLIPTNCKTPIPSQFLKKTIEIRCVQKKTDDSIRFGNGFEKVLLEDGFDKRAGTTLEANRRHSS